MQKSKNRQKKIQKNPQLRCFYTLGARSRVLHRHSQIVYSTIILAANQKTVFGGERLFFLGTFTVKKRHPLGIPLFFTFSKYFFLDRVLPGWRALQDRGRADRHFQLWWSGGWSVYHGSRRTIAC